MGWGVLVGNDRPRANEGVVMRPQVGTRCSRRPRQTSAQAPRRHVERGIVAAPEEDHLITGQQQSSGAAAAKLIGGALG
jgi:hypothetical protein